MINAMNSIEETENDLKAFKKYLEIELKATDSTGVIAMLCEVEFDNEALEILRYDDAKLIGGTLTAKTDESPVKLFWMDALATQNTLVDGTLGTFTFKALKAGKTEIKVNCVEAYTKDGDFGDVDIFVTKSFDELKRVIELKAGGPTLEEQINNKAVN